MSKKVCVVSGSRSEYSLLYPLLIEISQNDFLALQLVVTAMHLSKDFGSTISEIESDGFQIDEKIDSLTDLGEGLDISMAVSAANTLLKVSHAFERLKPDLVLLLGDRFETHAAASSALLLNIPIAHIHGGELSEGAIDEQLRHSITKMSHIHFCSTDSYRRRIIQMGENPKNVFNYGAPGIDNILRETLMTQEELSQDLEWDVSQNFILFTYHPVTIHHRSPKEDIQIILEGVRRLNMRVLFTYANADNGGSLINQMLEKFALQDPNKYKVVKSLGRVRYLSALKYSKILLGNSSSGIIEAASFCKPVVNIGDRQKGRIKGENVLDCQLDSVFETISYGVSDEFMEICNTQSNIYGDGNAAKRIVGKIASSNVSTRKEFFDLT